MARLAMCVLALLLSVAVAAVRAQDLVCGAERVAVLGLQQTAEFVLADADPPACFDRRAVYYAGNYSVKGAEVGAAYEVRYGDQECASPVARNDRYDYAARTYSDAYRWTNTWAFYGVYDSYFPKVQVWCGAVDGCNVTVTVCLNTYPLSKSDERGDSARLARRN